jgi:hypothetical protein
MPHRYKICIKGHLDHHWLSWLGDLALRHQQDGTTVLTGWIKDQSALHGLLIKIHDLSLTLLSLRRLDDDAAEDDDSQPADKFD